MRLTPRAQAAKPYSANAYAAKAAENKLGAAKAPKSTQPAAAEQMKQAGMEQMMQVRARPTRSAIRLYMCARMLMARVCRVQAMLGGGDSGMEQMMGALGGMEGMDGSGDMAADMAASPRPTPRAPRALAPSPAPALQHAAYCMPHHIAETARTAANRSRHALSASRPRVPVTPRRAAHRAGA